MLQDNQTIHSRSPEERIRTLLEELLPEERQLLNQILTIEQNKLHMGRPHGIYDELMQVVKDAIK